MKSMVITEFGSADNFIEMTLPIPNLIPGHVLIKVLATSVNPLDYKLRKGRYPDLIQSFPAVLQGDVAGVIEAVGEGVEGFVVGDAVYGCVGGFLGMGGGLSEYVLADADLIAHKPKRLSFAEAAALPLVALTAWEGLITQADVKSNQTVLIHGATGGVGHVAIQLAKWLGAKVYATCSSEKKMVLAQQLGADEAINYQEEPVTAYVERCTSKLGFDVIFDTVGGDNLNKCFAAAAALGKIVTVQAAATYDLTPAFLKGLSIHTIFQPLPLITGKNRKHYGFILKNVTKLVDEGIIHPLVDAKQFSIQDVAQAHTYFEQGQAIGKVVLTYPSLS